MFASESSLYRYKRMHDFKWYFGLKRQCLKGKPSIASTPVKKNPANSRAEDNSI